MRKTAKILRITGFIFLMTVLLPMSAHARLKVQKGTATIPSGQTTVTVNITPVSSLDKAFLIMWSTGDSGTDWGGAWQAAGYLSSTSQITFNRSETRDDCRIGYYVIEAEDNEFTVVDRGSITIGTTSLTQDTDIPQAIDQTRTFIVSKSYSGSVGNDDNVNKGYATVHFVDNDTIRATRGASGTVDCTVRYEVVEWSATSGVSVQSGVFSGNIGTAEVTDSIPVSVDTTRTWLYATFSHAGGSGLSQTAVDTYLKDGTTIGMRRYKNTYASDVRWWVIEFPPSVVVQRDNSHLLSNKSDLTSTSTFSNFDPDYSWSDVYANSNGTGQAFPRQTWYSQITSNTQVTNTRYYSGQLANISTQVIDTSSWVKPKVSLTVIPDPTKAVNSGGLEFKLVFDQSMNTSVEPTVTYDPQGATGPQSCSGGSWSTTNVTNDTYTVYNDNAITSSTGDGNALISISGAESSFGISMNPDTSHTFVIDTTVPTNPTSPCDGWDSSSKTTSIANDTWQDTENTPYFEWSGADDGSGTGVSGYSVYWGTDSNGEPGTTQEQSVNYYDVTTPVSDGIYYLRVRTFDNAGNYSEPSTLFIFKYDTTAPLNPSSPCSAWQTNLKQNVISNDTWQDADNTPYFEWSGANDQGGSGVSGYSVYWGTDPNGEPGTTKEQGASSYEVTTPTSDGVYYLRVRTFDNLGYYSEPVTLFTFKYDGTAPTNPTSPCSAWTSSSKTTPISNDTPQNLTQTPYFEWSGADDGSGTGVSGYSVYWGTDSNGEPGLTQEQTQASYEVTTSTGEGTYYLRVRTFDALGHYSSPITLFTFIYDETKPTVNISVLPNPAGHRAQGELEFTLLFSESMDTSTAPTVTYDPAGSTGAQPVSYNGSWSTTTHTNDTYTVYNSNVIDSSTGDGTASISVSGAKDIAGNVMLDDTDDTFTIDTTVDHFVITHDGSAMVDTPEDITITAKNVTNCTVSDFTGQITVSTLNETGEITWALKTGNGSFSDGDSGVDTATYTFSSSDNGVVVLQLTDTAADTLNIEATDGTHNDDDTEGNLVVSTTALGWFVISHDGLGVAGTPETITVTAKDTSGQTKTDYVGTITLDTNGTPGIISWAKQTGSGTFSDGGPSSDTATYTFSNNDNGVATFTINDTKAETINISAADGSITDDDTEGNLVISPGAIDHFVIAHNGSAVAGVADNVTITAYDAYSNIKTDYTGTITLDTNGTADAISWSLVSGNGTFTDGGAGSDTATYTYVSGDNGTATFSITDTKAESIDIDASGDGKTDDDTEGNLVVSPAAIDHFVISHDGSASAGVSEEVTVTAKDQYGNTKTDYTGTITLDTDGTASAISWALKTGQGTFTDGGAGDDTATYTFSASDNGSAVFSITDTSQESINISVTGDGKTDDDTEGDLVVGPPVIWSFVISHDGSGNAGTPEEITVTAKDSLGNTKTDYTGTITLDTNGTPTAISWALNTGNGSFNDGGASVDTAIYTFSSSDNGVAVFTITDNVSETIDIDVTGDGKTDDDSEGNLVIGSALLDHFLISHDGSATAGTDEAVTITAVDSLGQTKTDYTGTITVDTNGTPASISWALQTGQGTFTDGGANDDTATYTYASSDNGVVVLNINDTKAETINISVSGEGKTDDDTEGDLVINPGALGKFTIYHDGQALVDVPEYITIKAWDIYDNQKTDYTGTITVDTNGTPTAITWALQSGLGTFTDGGSSVDTATYTFSAGDGGVVVLKITDSAEETINISVSGDGKTDDDTEGDLVVSSSGSTLDMNWLYRRRLTIGQAISGYSVHLVLDDTTTPTASEIYNKCLSSGDDLRIGWWTGSGMADIDRDLVTFSSSKIDVWFRIQESGGWGGGQSNYYLYYGNPDAGSPPNNKDNVYLFFDDFNRADSSSPGSKWTVQDNPTHCGISNNRLYLGDNVNFTGQDVVVTANGTGGKLANSGILIQVKFMGNGSAPYQNSFVVIDWTGTSTMYTMGARIGANQWRDEQGYSSNVQSGTSETINSDQWHQMRIYIPNTTGTTQFWGKLATDSDFVSKGLNRDFGTLSDTVVGLKVQNAHSYFDDFLVRYKAATEPSVTASSTEERLLDTYLSVAANAVTTANVGVGDTDNLILDVILTNNWGKDIVINSVTLNNVGTASDAEISSVKLYYDSNNSGDYTSGIDSQVGSGVFSSGEKTFSGLSVSIPVGGSEYLFAVEDVSSSAEGGKTLDAKIPIEGIALSNGANITNTDLNSSGHRDIDVILDHFVISHDGASVAGSDEPVTITAKDSYGNTKTDYAGTITLDTNGTPGSIAWALKTGNGTFTDGGSSSDTATYTFDPSDNGVVVLNINDTKAETLNISASGDGKTDDDTEGNLVVSPGLLDHFVITHDGSAVAGVAEDITVIAKDAYDNTIKDYTGTITLDTNGTANSITWALSSGFGTFSDGGPSVDTATYTFSSSDNGEATFTITDNIAEALNISASGDGKFDDDSEGNLVVAPAGLDHFVISHDGSAIAGTPEEITITAKDALGNTKTDYTGQITLDTNGTATTITWALSTGNGTFSDGGSSSDTATYTYAASDNGVAVFTLNDTKKETINISVSGDGKTDDDTEGNLVISPGAIDHFVISHDGIATTGVPENVTITSYDAYDNIKDDYTGTITVDTNGTATTIGWNLVSGNGTFTDGGASSDTATYTFAESDNGVVNLSIIDYTAEAVNISVAGDGKTDDDTEGNLEFVSSGIDHFVISHDGNAISGVAESITIYAKDANGDTLTNYQGQITVDTTGTASTISWALLNGNGTFSDGGAGSDTCTYTYSSSDNGVVVLSITDTTEETINISVSGEGKTDDDTEGDLVISPAGLHHFTISHDGAAAAGVAEAITITAKDANENTVTDYTGQITVDTNGTATTITWAKQTGNGSFTDGGASADTATYNYVASDNGVCVLTLTDTKTETINISVSGGGKTDDNKEGNLVVSPGAIDHFVVSHDGQAVAGVSENITIRAEDAYDNIKTDYTGQITVDTNGTANTITWAKVTGGGTFVDGGPSSDTATYTFAASDNGQCTLSINDTKSESLNISVSGDGKTDDDTEGNLVVSPAEIDHFVVSHDNSAVAGSPEQITITAYDNYSNVKTDYTGQITVDTNGTEAAITWALSSGNGTFQDGGASVDTATYTYVSSDNGVVVLTVSDTKTESIDIDVSGDSKTDDDTEGNLVVSPAGIDHFVISHDGTTVAGQAENVTVTAYDAYSNAKTDYTGTITVDTNGTATAISWSLVSGNGTFTDGGSGTDTATYAFSSSDSGVVTLGLTDTKTETINIAVSGDSKTDDDTEGNLVVSPASIDHFTIFHDGSGVVDTPESITIYAKDSFGNTKTDYTGTITVDTNGTPSSIAWALSSGSGTFSDGGASVDTATYTYALSDSGTVVLTITDSTAETLNISVTGDGKTDDDTEGNLVINPVGGINTGFISPSANSGSFTNPANAYANDTLRASSTNGQVHQYYNYDFSSIPAGSIILGIEVRLDAFAQNTTGIYQYGVELSWDGGTNFTLSGNVTPDMSTSEVSYILGGPTDTWGRSWTLSELSNANFRVKINSTTRGSSYYAYLDWIPVKVYYEPPPDAASNPVVTDSVPAGQSDVLILDATVTSNGTQDRTINSVTVNNVGTTSDSEISSVKLYYDSNNSGDYTPGVDTEVGSSSFVSGSKTFSGLNIVVPGSGSEDLFVALDVANTVDDGDTLDVEIPANGISFSDGAAIEDSALNSSGERSVSLALDHFAISHDGTAVAGSPEQVTVTAKDPYGNTKTSYTGTITLDTNGTASEITWALSSGNGTFTDGGETSDTATYTFDSSDNGTVSFTITDNKAETINISVSGGGKTDDDTEGNLVISPAGLDHFVISHDGNATAGSPDNVTVTAKDVYGNTVSNYTGTITLDTNGDANSITWSLVTGFGTFTDGGASVDTATYTFSTSDNSTATFSITDTKAESLNISVSGDGKTDDDTEGNLVVSPSSLDHFVISHDGSAQAGVAENITITAKDQYENTITDYTGQITLDTNGTANTISWAKVTGSGVFSDGGVDVDTATYTYASSDNGVVVLSITDTTIEDLNISVSGDSKTDDDAEGLLSVGPGLIDHFTIFHDGFATQSQAENITIKAYDAYNNLKTDYVGTITVDTNGTPESITWALVSGSGTFNDGGAGVDTATYTYVASDNGEVILSLTDDTAEIINISVSGDGKTDDDNEGVLEVVAAGFHHFKITHDGNAVVGVPEQITITAKDANDVTVTNYVGTMTVDTDGTASTISWALSSGAGQFTDGGPSVDTATYTFVASDNGVVTLTITDTEQETINISASGGGKTDDDTEGNLVINPAGIHHFVISHDGSATAGVGEDVTITAKDANNSTVTDYTGTITVDTTGTAGTITWAKVSGSGTFTDGGAAVDTATYAFAASDNGVVTLSVSDTKTETFNISVSGDGKTDDDTEGNMVVNPAGLDHFVISHDGAAEAGVAEDITITAKDAYENTITDYTGQITVDTNGTPTTITWAKVTGNGTFTDGGASTDTATYTYAASDNGVVVLSINDTTTETINISVSGDSKTDDDTEGNLVVGAGALDKFVITHDGSAIAGTPESVSITAYDVYGNIKTNYTGTVTLDTNGTPSSISWALVTGGGNFTDGGSGSDTATYTFALSDNGQASFNITDTKAESINIAVSGSGKFDDDTEGNLVVNPAGLDHFKISHDTSATAGSPENIIIYAKDFYDNTQNDYTGTITVDTNGTPSSISWALVTGNGSFTDGGASSDTATYTFVSGDNGEVTLSVTDNVSEALNISVSGDSKYDDDSEGDLIVNPASIDHFVIYHDGSAVQSVGEPVTVTAKDAYGNTKTDYTGTITLDTNGDVNNISWTLSSGSGTFTDGGASSDTATYTFVSQDNGTATFEITDDTAETINISVSGDGKTDDDTEGNLVVQASSTTVDVTANDLSSYYISQGSTDKLVVDITLTNNDVLNSDTIQTVTVNNSGTISDSEVASVKLYNDSNSSGEYESGTDAQIASGTFSSGTLTFDNVGVDISAAGTKNLFVVIDLAATVTDASTVDVSIPAGGITFANSPAAEDFTLNSAGILTVDSSSPGDVSNLSTTSHNNAISAWSDPQSRDNTVYVSWSPANDSGSGIDGYSIVWDSSPTTLPDTVKDIEETVTSATSPALSDGTAHYFHIRSVDKVGNWASTAVHLGPFYIDTTPSSASIYQISEYAGEDYLYVDGNTVYYSGLGYSAFRVFVSASDAASGIKEAQFPSTTSAGGTDTTADSGAYQYLYTYEVNSAGSSYQPANVVVYDTAGNAASVPFNVVLDNTAPNQVSSILLNTTETAGTLTATWSDVTDSQTGLAGYSVVIDTNPDTIPPKYKNVNPGIGSYTVSGLANGTYYAHIRPVDNVGNWGQITHSSSCVSGRGLLSASITTSKSVVSTGQQFTVTMTVQNTGGAMVEGVDSYPSSAPTVNSVGGASAATTSNPSASDISSSGQAQFQWVYTAGSSSGTLSFESGAQGTDSGGVVTSNTAKSTDVVVEDKANLSLSVSCSPSSVNTSETINITVTISNTGEASALGATPSLTPSGTAAPVIDSGPSPASATIKGGRSTQFSYTAHGVNSGTAVFTANISSGTDENSGLALTATDAQDSVTVTSPPDYELTSSVTASPTAVNVSGTITVTMSVQNTGSSTVTNIVPSSLTVGGTSSDAIYVSGPDPANVSSLAPGATQEFSWTYTAGSTLGTVNFTGNAVGTQTSSGSVTSGDITIQAQPASLSSSISASPSSVLTNATITVTMTVSNTAESGGAAANSVSPSILTLAGTSGEANLLTGPNPSSADIAAGSNQDFVWTYKAGITPGTVNFTGNASGIDANSSEDVSSVSSTSGDVTIGTLTAEWEYPSDATVTGPIRTVPIAYDNNIYFGSDDNNLYVIDSTTHGLNASFTSSGAIRGIPWPNTEEYSPGVYKDIVYFGTLGKTVYGLWSDNTLKWERVMGDELSTSVLYDYYDPAHIYFGTKGNNVYALNATDGSNYWANPSSVGGEVESSPAMIYVPSLYYDEVYFGANDGKVYAFKATDNSVSRVFDTGQGQEGAIKTAPFIAPQGDPAVRYLMFFGTANGKFYAVNVSNLSASYEDTGWSTNPFVIPGGEAIYSAPWVDTETGYVYFGCEDGKLYALSVADGSSKPNFPVDVGSPIDSWPMVWNGVVYFGADNGKFYAVDVSTGEVVSGWPYDTGAPIKGGVSLQYIDENNIYILVGSDSGKLYSFKAVK